MGDRLTGLLLIVAGLASLALIGWMQQQTGPLIQALVPASPRPELLSASSPMTCLLGLSALGAFGLVLLGLKKLLFPEDWGPPRPPR